VPFHEQPTLLRAIRSHFRMLKQFGRVPMADSSAQETSNRLL
jgi:hypothetical protein